MANPTLDEEAPSASPRPFRPHESRLDQMEMLAVLTAFAQGNHEARLSLERDGLSGKVSAALNELLESSARKARDLEQLGRVLNAVKRGDFSARMSETRSERSWKVSEELNHILEINQRMAEEFERISKVVGKEGKITQRAAIGDVSGGWRRCVSSINSLIGDLVQPTSEMARVIGGVARGDLSQSMSLEVQGRPVKGEFLRIAKVVNTMVDQLNSFASEVTRVAREVGTEGKLGGQAQVKGVAGTWKDLTDNVNSMADNLTSQVRNIAEVTTAVAKGDLSKQITVDVRGEILELKNTINTMVDQLGSFASEVTRVAREVGTEGKLGGQAKVKGVAGTWKNLTDNVNSMAANLTSQVRNIADVTTAVAKGDLSRKITVDVRGEMFELKDTINTMVDQLGSFASEVTRVAREVGTEGKLGGQAQVKGVAGTWKALTDNVNSMAANLTSQVRNIADVTTAVAKGDLSKKITVDVRGEILALKNTVNTMVDQLNSFASEVTRVAREVGTEGKLGGQAQVKGVGGTWKDLTDNVNSMAANLTSQVRNIADVTTAVAKGDLSKQITVDVRGEILELKNTINTMVDQLGSFASEVTRVAREVGTEGKLGGQAQVKGVAGTWKDLTDNVNSMASNLTSQVRGIASVVTAVANGDLKRKLLLDVKGEIAALADTINGMIDTLAIFADQVTTVAHEVGVEGKLGGQAKVPGAAGTWRGLTDNVNQLAANLTTQVRAIAEVATAVTKGDLTRSITVGAHGEVAALKDNINEMIRNLKDTTHKNMEQDWLKTNLARFTRMLQGQRDLVTVSKLVLSELPQLISIQYGAFYMVEGEGEQRGLRLLGGYAYKRKGDLPERFALGEGLVGQCAVEGKRIILRELDSSYFQISSALGSAAPSSLIILPVLFEGEVKAIIELASFEAFGGTHLAFLDQLTESIGIVLHTIAANMRTEDLLSQSQSLTQSLQSQQIELTETNEKLAEKAHLLAAQKEEIELKNDEVELAKKALEEKADQLALTSKYKSQFLANMSHELRTPLNSLLILAKMLYQNSEGNLTDKQVEFAKTVHSSGSDLLALINEILDMSKIESGMITLELGDLDLADLRDYVLRTFRQIAQDRGLEFTVTLGEDMPKLFLTDSKRLKQVLKNLLSNAFKFTERGRVSMRMGVVAPGVPFENPVLQRAATVYSFAVEDSGIGIPYEKRKIIFEAFQQADMTTSRKYGGTGLGLTISREIAKLLGGEIHVDGAPEQGSTFTLFLPADFVPVAPSEAAARMDEVVREAAAEAAVRLPIEPAPRAFEHHAPEVQDDRCCLGQGDRVLMVVEDDVAFARILVDLARDAGFKVLVAQTGEAALAMAQRFKPDAVTLDIRLPDIDGWRVLDLLKHDPATRHVPVHIISVDSENHRGYKVGALACLSKPASPEAVRQALQEIRDFLGRGVKNLLIVEDDDVQRQSLVELLNSDDVHVRAAATGQEALAALAEARHDCMVLDLGLSDMSGFDLLEKIGAEAALRRLPVIVYTGKELSRKEEQRLRRLAKSIILKDVQSPELLLDETSLYLHRAESALPEAKRRMIEKLRREDPCLSGRKVLIVDDDVRNIFALTSLLEQHGVQVSFAENGRRGLEILESVPDIDLVLMDVMMPEMDGYETMRVVRANPKLRALPIVALTAKAMKEDREKCLEAGANDYIAKPVDIPTLLSHAPHEALPVRDSGAGPGEAGRIRILLVDDQPNNLLALSAMLQSPDFELVQAGSGAEALRCLLQEDFALVLLDVRMPVLDGFETAALIRKRHRSKDTPIIFVTAGHASEGGHQKGYGLGAVDYIYKPIVPEVLRAKVSVFADLFRKSERLRASEEALRRELSEHKVLEEARRASEDRYRELFARASDAIVVFEAADGCIVEANKAAVALYGWPRRELLRLSASRLSSAPGSASGAWKRAAVGRAPRSMVVEQKTRDGRCFPAEISYGVFSRDGKDMVLAVARDITQRRKVEQAERLIEREAMQREFVSTVSHELRTPISAIKGFTETLRRGGLDDEKNRLRFVRIIESHADRLSALVDGLLAIAAFEAGKDKPEPAPIPLAAFTEQILVGLQPLAVRKDLRFEVDMADHVQVWADPGQLARIFHNLVDNAIKYNRKGGRVRLSACASREDVQVTVDDTGMGIGPEDLPFVFEPFHRSERARALSIGGSGLGLCIVKGIVEANGGRIWAENRPEGGAAFHFTAPLAPGAAAPAPELSAVSGLLPSTTPTDEAGSEPAVCAAATAPRSTPGSARR